MGTRITAPWPNSSKLAAAERRFLQIAEEYCWLKSPTSSSPHNFENSLSGQKVIELALHRGVGVP
jgi:hypothetical protein